MIFLNPSPRGSTVATLLGLCLLVRSAEANDWSSRGFDAGQSHATTEKSGVLFRANSWRYPMPGATWNTSGPAVGEGIIVVGGRDGNVYALKATTGRRVWQFKTGDGVLASPAIHQGRVFVPSLDNMLYAFRLADGKLIWKKDLGGLQQSSPAVIGDSLVVAAGYPSRQLLRVDAATGDTIWATPAAAMVQFSNSSAVSDGDQVIVGAMGGHLYSFDLATGAPRWTYEADGVVNLGTPVIVRGAGGGGRVYLLPGGSSGRLHAVELATGQAAAGWPVELPAPDDDGTVAGKRLVRSYAVSSLAAGTAAGSGADRLLFDMRVDDSFDSDGDGNSDRFLMRESVMAVSATDGHLLWQQSNGQKVIDSANDMPKNWLCPTPAVYTAAASGSAAAGQLMLAASSLAATVQTLDVATGANRGNTTLAGPTRISPVLANGRLIVGTEAGVIQANLSSTNQPPDAPVVLGGAGRPLVSNVAPTLRWTAPLDPEGDAISYQLRLDRDGEVLESSEIEVNTGPGETSARLPRDLQAGATYVAAVRARDSKGAWSDWSAPQFFKAVETPPVSVSGAVQPSLAAALAAAAVTGGTVKLGAGTFYLAETLRVPGGVSLEGDGAGRTILDATGRDSGVSLEGTVDGKPATVKGLTIAGARVGIAVRDTKGARIQNVIIRDNWETGVDVSAAGTAALVNATLAANGRAVRSFGQITVKNSIVTGNQTGFVADHPDAITSHYNDLSGNGVPLQGMTKGQGDISQAVAFADYPKRDLRLLRGQPSTDQGDPADDFSAEPAPNGGRVNLGAFGATAEAELSAAIAPPAVAAGGAGCAVAPGQDDGGTDLGSLVAKLLVGVAALGLLLLRRRRAALLLVVFVCFSSRPSQAITCTWKASGGSGGNTWSQADKWTASGTGGSAACPPATNDNAVFNTGSVACAIDANVSVAAFSINSGYTGTVTQNSTRTIRVSGDFTASGAATFTGGDSAIDVGGNFALSAGTFTSTSSVLTVSGAYNKTGGTFTHNSGSVLLAATSSQTFASNGAAFNNLTINDGLIGYWKFEESATSFADSSGWGQTATWAGSIGSSTTVPTVSFTDTRSLNSSNTSTNKATFTSRADAPLITMTAWIKETGDGAGDYARIVELLGTPFWITSSTIAGDNKNALGMNSYRSGTDGRWDSPADSITPGVWTHVAITYDSTSTSNNPVMYINGVSKTVTKESATPTGTQASNVGAGYIAGRSANDRNFYGLIDELRLYNLSASEIATIAAGTEPTLGAATQSLTGSPSVAGDLKILTGTLSGGSATTLTVANNWTNYGTFTAGTSTVSFNGTTAAQTILANGSAFYNLTIAGSGSGAWSFTDTAATITNNLAISGGALTAPSGLLRVGGAFNKTGGTFNHNSGQVMLNSTSSQTFATNGTTFNNLTINDGLVGYWKLDEGSGTSIADSSGYGSAGTLVNGPAWVTGGSLPSLAFTDAAGVSFDGTNDYATLPVTNFPNNNGSKTVAFWAYWASTPGSSQTMFAMKNGSPGIQIGFNGSSQLIKVWSGATIYAAASSTPASGWHHIAYSYDGTNNTLYIDGVSVGTSTTAPSSGAAATGWLGTYNGSSELFSGRLDDLRIYNRALTVPEIYSLAIGRQPSTYLATQSMTGAPTVAGDLVIASGMLSTAANSLNVAGSWWNYGGIFRATGGTVTFNGSGSGNSIRSGGHFFQDVTINGTGSWTLADDMEFERNKTLTTTAGTLDLSSRVLRGGAISKTVDLTASTSTVVLDGTSNSTTKTTPYYNLSIEVPENNLVGYWKFDQGEGPLAWDYASTQHHGTLTNGPLWVNGGLPSAIEFVNQGAIDFDGTDDYVDVAAVVTSTNAAFSACAWGNLDVVSGDETMVGIDGTNVAAWKLRRNGTGGKFSMRYYGSDVNGASAVAATGTTSPVAGTWYHVCGIYDGSSLSLYVNGVLEAGPTTVSTPWSATNHTVIGAGKYNGAYIDNWNGKLDDVRIYNIALSATQVAALAGGRYANTGTSVTYTVGNSTTVNGIFSVDSGTFNANTGSTYTVGLQGAAYVNTGTYTVGGGSTVVVTSFTVRDQGTLNIATSGGRIKMANATSLVIDGTLNASNANSPIRNSNNAAAGSYYSFTVGSTATARPVLNITALTVENTDTNGMYINAVPGSVTTFTRFDNIAFDKGTGTQLLQIYAPSLYLVSNGCTFDTGVASGTTTYNVTLRGDGTATETRALFGNSTCATNRTPCESYDNDDDAGADGVGDTTATNGAVVQFVKAGMADTSGTIEGFPTAAFDWSTFAYYSTYVAYHDVGGTTADRIYLRDTNGNAKSTTSYWDGPTGEDLIGSPRYDTVSSVHYVYVATTAGKVYRLIDDTTANTLTQDNSGNWAGANNPYNCSCTITTPITIDTNNVYWGGTASGNNQVWTLGKTSRALAASSPLTVTAVISGAAPAGWVSGDTYLFLGSAAHFYKIDITTQTLTTDNASPTGTVNGRVSILNSKFYGADNQGSLWVLNPTSFGTTLWSYHDNTNHNGCASGGTCAISSAPYVDWALERAFYGDGDGHLYASYNSSGTTGAQSTGFPFRPGTSSEVYGSAPFYSAGIMVAGTTTGNLYVIDVNGGSGPVLKQTYKFGATTRVSGIGYDRGSAAYMVSTADATNKDGKLIYIDAMTDPTPGSN